MEKSGGYDTKIYSICAPWSGERGPKFTRIFEPAFKNGLLGKHDDFDNLFTTLQDNDMGGAGPLARAFPAGGGGAGMVGYRAKAIQAHSSRRATLCSLIRTHVLDPDIQEDIDTNANQDGIQAWDIVRRAGIAAQTLLSSQDQDSDWDQISLRAVGHTEKSMMALKGLIVRVNRERTVQKTNVDCVLKFLGSIRMPEALATKAVQEMQSPTHLLAAPAALAGQPDFNAIVNDFDEQWRVYFKRGKIPYMAPPSPKQLTNRVDASEAAQINSLEAELASLRQETADYPEWEEDHIRPRHRSQRSNQCPAFLEEMPWLIAKGVFPFIAI